MTDFDEGNKTNPVLIIVVIVVCTVAACMLLSGLGLELFGPLY